MLTHIMDQRLLEKGEGPIAVVLAPTRELAHQIYVETRRYAKIFGCKVCAIYGGVNKWEQIKALRQLCEVVIATPGRLIDLIRAKACPMKRITFLVLDEADQMLSHGFEPQVRTIANRIRPDRQTVFFSATFNKKLKLLARDILRNPIEIRTGTFGSHDLITQEFIPFQSDNEKWNWLASNLKGFVQNGKVLVFVSQKAGCDQLASSINSYLRDTPCVHIHGDKSQQERTKAIQDFKGNSMVLVATDVASRGLHIPNVNTVICFDAARNIDSHTHRIGRTGRMGKDGAKPGKAYVLLTKNDTKFSQVLLKTLRGAKQKIPQFLSGFAHAESGSSNVGSETVYKGKRRRVIHEDWSQRGSGRSDVSSAREKTVGLGFTGSTNSSVWMQKDTTTHLYSVFVKGDELKPKSNIATEVRRGSKSGLSREERNSLKFTISHQAVAKQWADGSAGANNSTVLEKLSSRKSRWDESGSTMKTETTGKEGNPENLVAKKRKSRWDIK
uniref:RNA helicase n=2 Tax=Aplanochytrium stocchinoi TaxID=215587 RepID=A0A7S3LTS7_9STRA|mmetsp:Transcript_925/g.1315  ORF Transcript_925/g.1315 Transcript_925/m.1315 type:complete len:499 (+) Transcript_925:1037-2533(+)